MMEEALVKAWYKSKIVWANVTAIVAMLVLELTPVLDGVTSPGEPTLIVGVILAVSNVALRVLATNQAVTVIGATRPKVADKTVSFQRVPGTGELMAKSVRDNRGVS